MWCALVPPMGLNSYYCQSFLRLFRSSILLQPDRIVERDRGISAGSSEDTPIPREQGRNTVENRQYERVLLGLGCPKQKPRDNGQDDDEGAISQILQLVALRAQQDCTRGWCQKFHACHAHETIGGPNSVVSEKVDYGQVPSWAECSQRVTYPLGSHGAD